MIRAKSTTNCHRLYWLDLIRAGLVLAMIGYHFYWDLVYFQIIHETAHQTYLSRVFAHTIAVGFLFVAGFSIVISSQKNNFVKKFLWRFGKILSAAFAISYMTYIIFPQDFIYFGILHEIAISSLLIACLLRANFVIDFLIAAAIIILSYRLQDTNPANNVLPYLGLAKNVKSSVDFVPIFPWSAFAVLGSAVAKLYLKNNLTSTNNPKKRYLGKKIILILSEYSLLIYLVHQPILFGALYFNKNMIYMQNKIDFIQNCITKCSENNNQKICPTYCKCMQNKLKTTQALSPIEQAVKLCKSKFNQ